jgi:hypothetical protein
MAAAGGGGLPDDVQARRSDRAELSQSKNTMKEGGVAGAAGDAEAVGGANLRCPQTIAAMLELFT